MYIKRVDIIVITIIFRPLSLSLSHLFPIFVSKGLRLEIWRIGTRVPYGILYFSPLCPLPRRRGSRIVAHSENPALFSEMQRALPACRTNTQESTRVSFRRSMLLEHMHTRPTSKVGVCVSFLCHVFNDTIGDFILARVSRRARVPSKYFI